MAQTHQSRFATSLFGSVLMNFARNSLLVLLSLQPVRQQREHYRRAKCRDRDDGEHAGRLVGHAITVSHVGSNGVERPTRLDQHRTDRLTQRHRACRLGIRDAGVRESRQECIAHHVGVYGWRPCRGRSSQACGHSQKPQERRLSGHPVRANHCDNSDQRKSHLQHAEIKVCLLTRFAAPSRAGQGVQARAAAPLDPFYPGDIALAAAQHQPAAVQEIRCLRRPFVAVDANVVDRQPTFADRAPGRALAGRKTTGHQ